MLFFVGYSQTLQTSTMDSINQQQPEENFKNLAGAEAISKIKELVNQSKTCFFCSNIKTGIPFSTRPMSVQKIDEEGNLWFLSANDSHQNEEPALHLVITDRCMVHQAADRAAAQNAARGVGGAEGSQNILTQPDIEQSFVGGRIRSRT